MSKKRLFKLNRKDFIIQTFRAGGPGGQYQNKRDTGVRIIHPASGAVGESRSEKSQRQNRKLAFKRMADSKEFKLWVRITAAHLAGRKTLEEIVDEMMQPEFLKIEKKVGGKWIYDKGDT